MSEIKNGGLDQYGAESFEQQQFRTVGIEGVKVEMRAKNDHRPGPPDDNAFLICTAEIFPIAAIGQPDKLSTNRLLTFIP